MNDSPSGQEIKFGWETLARLGRAVLIFARCEVGGQAKLMAALLLVFLIAINGLNVINSYVGRDFMTAVERRDAHDFFVQATNYVAVFALLTVAAVLYRFTEERLGLLWREHITRSVVTSYLQDNLHYRWSASGVLTNPDQRIADDVRTFTTTTLSLALIFLNGGLTIIAFSGVLWSISRLLFVVAVAYAAVGSLIAFFLGRPLVKLNYDQADKEAYFRSDLIHVRENTESVALLHREAHMRGRLLDRVDSLVGNFKRIIAVNRNLGFFTTGYNYMIQLIPLLIVAPLFIRGAAEFGVISQSSMAFAHVLGAFSLLVTQFPSLSSYAAVLARLSPIAGSSTAEPPAASAGVAIVEDERRFAFEGVTLRSPHDGRELVRGLSFEVRPSSRIMVKSATDLVVDAMQRAIVGIWSEGEGRIVRPRLECIALLPDRPYLPPGQLRELIGGGEAKVSDEQLWQALRALGADGAVERVGGLDVEHDWDDLFSLDEQRLVNLARVLVVTPRFTVISHLGSGLGAEGAGHVIEALVQRGIGCVVLGDGILTRAGFDMVIEIQATGEWKQTSA